MLVCGLVVVYQFLDSNSTKKSVEKVTVKKESVIQDSFLKTYQCYKHVPANQNHKMQMDEIDPDLTRAPASVTTVTSNAPAAGVSWITSQSLQRKIAQRNQSLKKKKQRYKRSLD